MAALPAELHGMDAGLGERRLWAEALKLMLHDGRNYWRSQQGQGVHAENYRLEQAFDDLVRCGPMLRHCCGFLDLNAEWISAGFVSLCEEK